MRSPEMNKDKCRYPEISYDLYIMKAESIFISYISPFMTQPSTVNVLENEVNSSIYKWRKPKID